MVLQTGQQIDSRLILGYYKHLLNLPQRFFDSMRVGEIISRVNDAVRIRIFINDVALNVIVNLLSVVLCIALMFMYYWKLALAVVCSVPVYLLIYRIGNRLNAKWQRNMMETSAALESQLVEGVQNAATIRRFGVAEWFNLKTENRFVPLMRAVFVSGRKRPFADPYNRRAHRAADHLCTVVGKLPGDRPGPLQEN
jgi:ATP-binding cassette subfamily B protein